MASDAERELLDLLREAQELDAAESELRDPVRWELRITPDYTGIDYELRDGILRKVIVSLSRREVLDLIS